jgi:divalent metal cation (Fe/Co/Zn/Cd) transporter
MEASSLGDIVPNIFEISGLPMLLERLQISGWSIIRTMNQESTIERKKQIKRGLRLEYFTIAYNSLEGLISIIAGLIAGSVSLVGFGIDSVIEIISGAALIWRLGHDLNPERRESAERMTLRIIGSCFIALAIYILYDSGSILLRHEAPERSVPGIVIAALSAIVMPLLARAKRRVASNISSAALQADSRQTDFCTYLSVILLGGLLLNALLGWWWADPTAALIMVPIIANEGIRAVQGQACSDDCGCHSSELL